MEKMIIIENAEWRVECWLENEQLKTWFKSPVALPIHTSSDKSLIQDFEDDGLNSDRFVKFFTTTLQSIIKQKYNAKIKDSFNTFYTQRGFQEILNILNNSKITDKIEALKNIQFDVTKRIKKDETILYVNEYKQYKDKIEMR